MSPRSRRVAATEAGGGTPDPASADPPSQALSPSSNDPATEAESSAAAAGGSRPRKKRLDVNPDLILAEGRNKRRRTPSPQPGDGEGAEVKPEESEEEKLERRVKTRQEGDAMLKAILAEKDKEGRQLSKEFIHLPPPKLFPDYYEVIKNPKSISQIESKLKLTPKTKPNTPSPSKAPAGSSSRRRAPESTGSTLDYEGYNDLAEVVHDFGVVWNNCKRYNAKEALIYADARRLHKITRDLYNSFLDPTDSAEDDEAAAEEEAEPPKKKRKGADGIEVEEEEPKKTKGKTVYRTVKSGLKKLDEATNADGNRAADFFDELPSRRDYADYYKVIAKPISLAEIRTKLTDRAYKAPEEWEADVTLMCNNAKQYNVEGSVVYQDAVVLQDCLAEIMTALIPSEEGQAGASAHAPLKLKLHLGGSKKGASSAGSPGASDHMDVDEPRPNLPANQVNEDIVKSLDKYSEDEKAVWVKSLDSKNVKEMQRLRKAVNGGGLVVKLPLATPSPRPAPAAVKAAAPVLAASPAPAAPAAVPAVAPAAPVAELAAPAVPPPKAAEPAPVAAAPAPAPTSSPAKVVSPPRAAPPAPVVDPVTVPKRPLPTVPLIRVFNFTYDLFGEADTSIGCRKKTVKLRNFRGVLSHSLYVRQGTRSIELTSYLEEGFFNLNPLAPGETDDSRDGNRNPGIAASLDYAPLPVLTLTSNGQPYKGALIYPGDDYAKRPIGCKWTVPFSSLDTNMVLEVTVARDAEPVQGLPGNTDKAVKETCMVFVARQT